MSALSDRASDVPGAVKAPATNLTLGSAIIAFLAVIGTAIEPVFEAVFPDGASDGIRAAVLIAVIAAWALIGVADIIMRGVSQAATARSQWVMSPVESGITATRLEAVDSPGWTVAAVRFPLSTPEKTSYLLVKAGETPAWVDKEDVQFG